MQANLLVCRFLRADPTCKPNLASSNACHKWTVVIMCRLQPTASMSSGLTFASINERYTYNTGSSAGCCETYPFSILTGRQRTPRADRAPLEEGRHASCRAPHSGSGSSCADRNCKLGVNPMHLPRADPPASISIEQRWRLDQLLPILASLAFKRIVRIRNCSLIEFEELS